MSRQRQKGTEWETELLNQLAWCFPNHVITRAGTTLGCNDAGDFVGCPFPVEAKSTKTMRLPEWLRKLRTKATATGEPNRWALFWHGDRRTQDGQELMIVPGEFGRVLLRELYGRKW